MTFYLGTHHPDWLSKVLVPLFVSRNRLVEYRTLPRALSPWALDSGAFSEIDRHGGWTVPARQYAREARRFQQQVGRMRFAAIQDWMCEPVMLAKTGLSVAEHQRLTTRSYAELSDIEPRVPWMPILQGWEPDDYLRHWETYERAGVDLAAVPIVGVGSVCKRQDTEDLAAVVAGLRGLRLHGFGVKKTGLQNCRSAFHSADSMAWSFEARRRPPLPGHRHKNCANCVVYALQWYREVA